jgi:hypothetical protein
MPESIDTQDREAAESPAARRETRRALFTAALGVTAGAGALALASRADAQTVVDADLMNFALNLKYLEANYYAFVTTGSAIGSSYTSGITTAGASGTATGGRKLTFTDTVVSKFATEIAAEKLAHVAILRSALGVATVAQPAIDLTVSANTGFSVFARAAGLIGDGATFDPYASDENFLLGAFMFEDVTVSALKGLAPLMTNLVYLDLIAALLGTSAYHAAMIRTTLYRKGLATPSLIDATEKLSAFRDRFDGGGETDQGVAPVSTPAGTATNIVPADANGLIPSRSSGQVLNILYLTTTPVAGGGFFPAGVNGVIKTNAGA